MFKMGDVVKWKSQAGGNTKEKVGEVVMVVSPREAFVNKVEFHELIVTHRIKAGGWGAPRNHESYLVSVRSKNPKAKPFLYWPRVKHLYK